MLQYFHHTAVPRVLPISEVIVGVVGLSAVIQFIITMDQPPVTLEDIQWSYGELVFSVSNSSRIIFSPDMLTLTIADISYKDEGTYTLSASNLLGSGSASIFLDVQGDSYCDL